MGSPTCTCMALVAAMLALALGPALAAGRTLTQSSASGLQTVVAGGMAIKVRCLHGRAAWCGTERRAACRRRLGAPGSAACQRWQLAARLPPLCTGRSLGRAGGLAAALALRHLLLASRPRPSLLPPSPPPRAHLTGPCCLGACRIQSRSPYCGCLFRPSGGQHRQCHHQVGAAAAPAPAPGAPHGQQGSKGSSVPGEPAARAGPAMYVVLPAAPRHTSPIASPPACSDVKIPGVPGAPVNGMTNVRAAAAAASPVHAGCALACTLPAPGRCRTSRQPGAAALELLLQPGNTRARRRPRSLSIFSWAWEAQGPCPPPTS